MMLWRIFGPWRNEKSREWRKIYKELLNDLYCLHEIFQIIKSRRINLAGHLACRLTGELYAVCWWGKQGLKFNLGDVRVEGQY